MVTVPDIPSVYSTVPDIDRTCVILPLFGLLISDIGISSRRWNHQVSRHARHRSTRWHWNLLLASLACLVSFVCPLLLVILFRSFGAQFPRILFGARPPHVANCPLLLPFVAEGFPQHPVEPQLIFHAPSVLDISHAQEHLVLVWRS